MQANSTFLREEISPDRRNDTTPEEWSPDTSTAIPDRRRVASAERGVRVLRVFEFRRVAPASASRDGSDRVAPQEPTPAIVCRVSPIHAPPRPMPSRPLPTRPLSRSAPDPAMTDEELWTRFTALDCQASLDMLHRRYFDPLHAWIRRCGVRDEARVADLFQGVWVRLVKNRHRFDPAMKWGTWAFHVARNLAKNEGRRLQRRFVTPGRTSASSTRRWSRCGARYRPAGPMR